MYSYLDAFALLGLRFFFIIRDIDVKVVRNSALGQFYERPVEVLIKPNHNREIEIPSFTHCFRDTSFASTVISCSCSSSMAVVVTGRTHIVNLTKHLRTKSSSRIRDQILICPHLHTLSFAVRPKHQVAAALMAEWTVVAGVEGLAVVVVDLDLKQSTG